MEAGRLIIKLQFPASRSLIYLPLNPAISQTQLAGIGILVAFLIATGFAFRDGVDRRDVWAFLGIAGLFALAGGRLFNLFLGVDGFASVGAIAAAGLVVVAHRWLFGIAETLRVLDVTAPAGLAALALARLGCLFEGCDFGAPTSGRFAVRYSADHPIWHYHERLGIADTAWSAPIHPFPLYIVAGATVLVLAAGFVRGGGGLRAGLIVVGYCCIRTVAELFRDSPSASLIPVGVSLALLATATTLWWIIGRRNEREIE